MSAAANVESVVGTWFVGHVKPSQERRLADELDAKGIDHYLPLVRRRVNRNGRMVEGNSVLFPQYIFFAGTIDPDTRFCEAQYQAIMTHRLCGVLQVANQAKFVRQIRGIQLAIEEDPKIGSYHGVVPGSRCVIKAPHKLMGIEGRCEAVRQNRHTSQVVLRVDMLGQSVAVDIAPEFVEVL